MKDYYIHIGDFEKYVRNRFKHIVGGKGLVIPRIAVKKALDDIFADEPHNTVLKWDGQTPCDFCDSDITNCHMGNPCTFLDKPTP